MSTSGRTTLMRNAYAAAVGVAGGATVGIVGWGGGQVIIPSMTYPSPIANFSQLAATGFSLSSLSVSALTSGSKFLREDRVDVPIALAIGIPAVFSARLGSHLAKKLSGNALELFFNSFTIFLIPTHFWIQQRAKVRHAKKSVDENSKAEVEVAAAKESFSGVPLDLSLMKHVSCGVISGTVSALIGVGGLPLTMSYLTETTDLPHHYVQGTAMCALVPSILVSTFSIMNVIPLQTAGCVALGGVAGGYSGAKLALSLSEDELRFLYMGSLVLFGGRSTVGAARNIRRIWSKYYLK